jgi:hypothetical protein
MKKIYRKINLLLGVLVLCASSGFAQVATNYAFSQTTGSYTPLGASETVLAKSTGITSIDDNNFAIATLPFSFTFDGTSYTSATVNSNGSLFFGTASSNTVYTAISGTGTYSGAIAAFNRDLSGLYFFGDTGKISTDILGVAPNRVFVVQYANLRPYSSTVPTVQYYKLNFQIRLNETSNTIDVVYNNSIGTNGGLLTTAPAATSCQVGLRGPSNIFATNVNNRLITSGTHTWAASAAGTSNSSVCATSSTLIAASGQTYTWTPQTPCSGAPTSGSILGASALCAGNSGTTLSLTGNTIGPGITYQWASASSIGGPYANLGTGITQATGALTATTYFQATVTCTNSALSSTTSNFTVVVNPLPTISVNPATVNRCAGDAPTALTASGGATYAWSPSVGLSAASGASVNASPGATTTYTVTGTDANGCINTGTVAITVNNGVSITASSASPATICAGDSSQLAVVGAGIVTAYCIPTYTNGTSFGDYLSKVQLNTLNISSLGAPSPFYTLYPDTGTATTTLPAGVLDSIILTAGTFSSNDLAAWIDYNQDGVFDASEKLGQIENLGASPATAKFLFTVPSTALNGKTRLRVRELDGTAGIIIDPCTVQSAYGEVEDFVITISGGVSAAFTYTWSPSTFLNSTSASTVNALNVTATTPYSVIVSNGLCSDTANITLTVNALPIVAANSTASAICAGTNVTLTGSGASTYTWNNGVTDGTAFAPTATSSYTVTGTDANGCKNTANTTVTVNALPTVSASVSPNDTVCAGTSVTLSGAGAVSYAWDNGVTDNTAFTAGTTTTYTVTGTDANGCSSTASQTITVNALPTVTANTTAGSICAGASVTLTGSGATSYVWDNGVTDGVAITPTATTTYNVTGTDANGCVGTASTTVTVNAQPIANLPATISTCDPSTILDAGNATLPGVTYLWTPGGATTQTITVTSDGTYSVVVTGTGGCNVTSSTNVTLNAGVATSNVSAASTSLCVGANTTLVGTPSGGTFSANGTGGVFNATTAGTFDVTYTVTTSCGTAIDTVTITVNANPVAGVTSSGATICAGGTTALTLTGTPVGGTYSVQSGSAAALTGNSFNPATIGNYVIVYTVTNANGCTDTANINFNVNCTVGLNDIAKGVASITAQPNPNNGNFELSINNTGADKATIKVLSMEGRVIAVKNADLNQNTKVDMTFSNLANGVYFVNVISGNVNKTIKLTKQD